MATKISRIEARQKHVALGRLTDGNRLLEVCSSKTKENDTGCLKELPVTVKEYHSL